MAGAASLPFQVCQFRDPDLATRGLGEKKLLNQKLETLLVHQSRIGNKGICFTAGHGCSRPCRRFCFSTNSWVELQEEGGITHFADVNGDSAGHFSSGNRPVTELHYSRVMEAVENARSLKTLESSVDDERRAAGEVSMAGWESDKRLLGSCEVGQSLRVAVLVSGGVDSSVALRLLCAAGHSCTAFYLKIWFQEDFENFWSACPWEEDLKYAQAVCDEVGVELRVVHLTDEYWKHVASDVSVAYSISEIHAGRTPNPDILCNSHIKFGAFLEHIEGAQFDRVASGHYARVEHLACDGDVTEPCTVLLLSADQVKDQTYFLSHLSQVQLSHLLFPLGGLSKVEVRQLAEAMGLLNQHRKDSQGICFLGKVKFGEFIARHLGEQEGRLLEAETGEFLGIHRGFWFYTIGQRQGLGLSNGPWFVVAKDVEHNVVFISRKYYSDDKRRRTFRVASFNWISQFSPTNMAGLRCKVRHGANFYSCTLEFDASASNVLEDNFSMKAGSAVVNLSEDDQGLAPGQYTAFYMGEVCLGSAVITEALGGPDFSAVSAEALEAAWHPFDLEVYKNLRPRNGSLPRCRISNKSVAQSDCSSSVFINGGNVSGASDEGNVGNVPTQQRHSSKEMGCSREGYLAEEGASMQPLVPLWKENEVRADIGNGSQLSAELRPEATSQRTFPFRSLISKLFCLLGWSQ